MTTTGPQKLAAEVLRRREELGLTQTDVASRGDVGIVTVGGIERGEIGRPQPSTLRKIDRALRWKEGSAAGVLQGREPVPLADDETPAGAEVIAAIEREQRLLPEARAHLINQLELLLRLQEASPAAVREQERRRHAAKKSAEVDRRLKAVEEAQKPRTRGAKRQD